MPAMTDISDPPVLHDIDADYTPRHVQLARILRDKIEGGEYEPGDILPGADLAREYEVSIRVTYAALAMLAANRGGPRDSHRRCPSVTAQDAVRELRRTSASRVRA
jgi:DNA-binding transcriptional MocR family regulator